MDNLNGLWLNINNSSVFLIIDHSKMKEGDFQFCFLSVWVVEDLNISVFVIQKYVYVNLSGQCEWELLKICHMVIPNTLSL